MNIFNFQNCKSWSNWMKFVRMSLANKFMSSCQAQMNQQKMKLAKGSRLIITNSFYLYKHMFANLKKNKTNKTNKTNKNKHLIHLKSQFSSPNSPNFPKSKISKLSSIPSSREHKKEDRVLSRWHFHFPSSLFLRPEGMLKSRCSFYDSHKKAVTLSCRFSLDFQDADRKRKQEASDRQKYWQGVSSRRVNIFVLVLHIVVFCTCSAHRCILCLFCTSLYFVLVLYIIVFCTCFVHHCILYLFWKNFKFKFVLIGRNWV